MGQAEPVGYSGVTVNGAGFTGSAPAGSPKVGSAADNSAQRSVGYSGVTADGAGFTGNVPVPVSPLSLPLFGADTSNGKASESATLATGSGYSNTLTPPIEQYDLSKEFGFIPRAQGATAAPAPYQGIKLPTPDVLNRQLQMADIRASAAAPSGGPRPYADASLHGYSYMRSEVVGTGGELAAARVMGALQRSPDDFFPFSVRTADGSPATIEPGRQLILEDRYEGLPMLPPGENPVEVVEVTPNSFTFKTLPGHFDPPGSMISFMTAADVSGQVLLMHLGTTLPDASPSPKYLYAPIGANIAWTRQTEALRQWLANHPGPDR